MTERTAFNWHCYLPGVGPGPALRLPRPRTVRPGGGAPLQPHQAPDRPVRQGDRRSRSATTSRTCCPTSPTATTPTSTPTTRTTSTPSRSASSSTNASTGRTTGCPRRPWSETVIYETHVKGFTKCNERRPRATCAAPTPGSRRTRRSVYLAELGVTAVELLPVHHIADEKVPDRQGAVQLLGLQLDRLLRAARPATRRRGAGASRCASSRAW